jgi:chemotaxis protein MotB
MAGIKKKKSGGGGANWMDTYGDMVTLLLCFFVLLYSMSTIDQSKWKAVVQSFNGSTNSAEGTPPAGLPGLDGRGGGEGKPLTEEEVEQALTKLYENLEKFVETQQSGAPVTVSKGDGYVFISFNDAIFFDGDSYVLRKDGQTALDTIVPALAEAGPYIDELRVLGHTAQASPDRANDPTADRFLASNRSTVVLLYLQEHIGVEKLDPARIVGMQYGQWRPIASNDSQESRMQNRRVELVIAGRDVESQLSDSVRRYYSMNDQAPPENDDEREETP